MPYQFSQLLGWAENISRFSLGLYYDSRTINKNILLIINTIFTMSNSNLPRKIIYGSGGYVTDIRRNLATFRRFMMRRSVPIQRLELVKN